MEARTRPPTQEQSAIVERVARIVSRVRGAKPDYARLAAELEPAIPFDVFGIVLLRHDREAVRVTVCMRDADTWVVHYHQHPLKDSMFEHILQQGETARNQEGAGTATTWPHMAAAIESAQVGGNVEIQDRQREELKNVSSALTSEMDLPMILNRIVVGIAKALNVASAIITQDRRRGSLKLEA